MQEIFNNILKKRTLNLLKYNQNIKKRINLNINNYKEYSQKYSSIEIEIKPLNNEYGKFINIKKENEKYYHIYFDDNKEEIKREKREYILKSDNITKIKIIIDYQIVSFKKLFYNLFFYLYLY